MILSNVDIKKALQEEKIIIDPPPEDNQFFSSALDLRLGNEFKEYNPKLIKQKGIKIEVIYSEYDFKEFARAYLIDFPKEHDGSVIIKPKDFVLAMTHERIELPMKSQIAARVEGRSSAARLGLVMHLSAPTIHAGFSGKITLEIINHGYAHVRLFPEKDRICQLIFEQLSSMPEKANISQFQGQTSVTGNHIPS
jgi:dCTP deaminase